MPGDMIISLDVSIPCKHYDMHQLITFNGVLEQPPSPSHAVQELCLRSMHHSFLTCDHFFADSDALQAFHDMLKLLH